MSDDVIEIKQGDDGLCSWLRNKHAEVDACYQCLRCSAGCPMLSFMDHPPNQLIRMAQYGLEEEVLRSNTIWMCASCQTCTTRCPNEVEIAHLMDVLRQEAIRRGIKSTEQDVEKFHRAFVKEMRRGRIHELSLIGRYKLSTRKFTDDMKLGMEMFKRGRMKLIPRRVAGAAEVKRIYEMAEKGE